MSNTIPLDTPHELDAVVNDEEQRERFRIYTDATATWAMKRLAAIRAKQRENIAIADAEMQRITDWIDAVNNPLGADASYFESLLADYGRRQRQEEDRKSINLIHGKIATRAGNPKWHINAEMLMPWLRANAPDLIKVKEEPSLTAIKETFAEQVYDGRVVTVAGEPVPGVTVEQIDMTVSVTVNE